MELYCGVFIKGSERGTTIERLIRDEYFTVFFGACAFNSSPAQANISDSDADIQAVDGNFFVEQPAHASKVLLLRKICAYCGWTIWLPSL